MVARRRRSKKWIWWVVLLLLLIGATVVCYLVWDNYLNNQKLDNNEEEQIIQVEPEMDAPEEVGVVNNQSDEMGERKVKQYEGDDPNTHSDLSGAITYAGVVDDVLMVRINIDQFLDDGECKITLSKDGVSTYSSVARILGNVSTSTCEGFDIPINQLGQGYVQININLSANDKNGIIRGEVNI